MPTIDLPTLFMVSTALFVLMAVMFFVTWRQDERNNAAMLPWAGAHFLGAPACVLLALRGEIPGWLSIGVANFVVLTAFGLTVAGALAFEGRRFGAPVIFGGAVLWAAAVPTVWNDFSLRVVLVSLLISTHAFAAAAIIWHGRKREPLPTRGLVAILFAAAGAAHLARIGVIFQAPVSESFAVLGRSWVAFIGVQILMQEVLLGYALLAMVKERAESHQRRAAEIDTLTGALTRGAFRERAAARLEAEPRRGAVLLFDLDRFKAINDTHGHAAGDRVLAEFAEVVSGRLGAEDLFGRYGGEEFALLLAEADVTAAWRAAEDIRRGFALRPISHAGRDIAATVSVGVAAVPLVESDLDQLVASADAALYLAKQGGRDRVEGTTAPALMSPRRRAGRGSR
ncbi:MAG: GGDEF domain-containing protein [Siculibacillus sp.]|nr:GGDEF domain-containing protein [Siculibacillus sp.]